MKRTRDVAIIGAGPAGIAAAVYLKRVGVEPIFLERGEVGGLLRNANLVENYPGFPEGIGGTELVALLKKQLRKWGIVVTAAEVTRITRDGGFFVLHTAKGAYASRFLIVATGTRPKAFNLPGLDTLPICRVHHEVAEIQGSVAGQRFLVIGGGDAAFDYALNLASKGCETDVLFKSDRPRCIPLLLARAKGEDSIHLFPRHSPVSVEFVGGKVVLRCIKDKRMSEHEGDSLLIACGRESELGMLPQAGTSKQKSWSKGKTERGLFIVGDARRGLHRQLGIAVGDGIHAAMSVVDLLKEDSNEDIG